MPINIAPNAKALNDRFVKRWGSLLVLLLVFFSLSGCATYFERQTQNKCFYNDWFAQGFDAAKHGKQGDQAWAKADKRCEKVNVWSNQTDFNQGYTLGAEAFCQTENGFEFGLRGKRYHPICGTLDQVDFDGAYSDGLEIRYREQDLQRAISSLDAEQDFIEYATRRRRELAYQIDNKELDNRTLKRAVKERYRLKQRRRSARNKIVHLRSEIRQSETQLSELEDQLYQYYYPEGKPDQPLYSVSQSVIGANNLVTQPAIFLYQPKKLKGKGVRQVKQTIRQTLEHVTTHYPRSFRFQMTKDAELTFIDQKMNELVITTHQKFQDAATLLLWSPDQGLSTITLKDDFETIKQTMDTFMSQNTPASAQ